MSYNVLISRNTVSPDDKQAWAELNVLSEKEKSLLFSESGREQGPDFLDLIEKLKATFPCICDLPDEECDNGVWSDGPLSNNAGKDLAVLGIRFSESGNVMPFLIKTANENGFVVFDPQTDMISRPKLTASVIIDKTVDDNQPKAKKAKSFWRKLFGT